MIIISDNYHKLQSAFPDILGNTRFVIYDSYRHRDEAGIRTNRHSRFQYILPA